MHSQLQSSDSLSLTMLREQLLTWLLRVSALLATFALSFTALLLPLDRPPLMLTGNLLLVSIIWLLALARQLGFRLRIGMLLAGLYLGGLGALAAYGLSQQAMLLLAAFSLCALLLFSCRAALLALSISTLTLLCAGIAISSGIIRPLAYPVATLALTPAITSSLFFLIIVGTMQASLIVICNQLRIFWQQTHSVLEQRVAERTYELEQARDQALALSHSEMAQKEYMRELYQITLDLLSHHRIADLLQRIVEKAALLLDAPYGELMLVEDDELVVYAFTDNQPFLANDRVRRGEALLSWRAFDTRQPVVLDDYAVWAGRRDCYNPVLLHAVADFPILAGETCLGVLAMGRDRQGHLFTPDDILKGQLFSQLAAILVETTRLYERALQELSRRLEVEQALQRYMDELQAQNDELQAFTHTVAHDLKTPLSAINGYSQLLMVDHATLPAEERAELLALIVRATTKMSSTIDALLLLSRIRSSDKVPVDTLAMHTIIVEAEVQLESSIAASGATIRKPEHWPEALGYAPWIEEVWINYISNAIKYGGQSPQIQLGGELVAGGFVCFWVQDNGLGLDAAQQAQLFRPFTRFHTDSAQGHGLGLSIVQRIISRLGGSVGVESAPGQGSRFFFTLPAAAAYKQCEAASCTDSR